MRIEDFFKLHKEVAVAFSGGVDSADLISLCSGATTREQWSK